MVKEEIPRDSGVEKNREDGLLVKRLEGNRWFFYKNYKEERKRERRGEEIYGVKLCKQEGFCGINNFNVKKWVR